MAPLLYMVVRIKNGIVPNLLLLTLMGTIHAHIRLTMSVQITVSKILSPRDM